MQLNCYRYSFFKTFLISTRFLLTSSTLMLHPWTGRIWKIDLLLQRNRFSKSCTSAVDKLLAFSFSLQVHAAHAFSQAWWGQTKNVIFVGQFLQFAKIFTFLCIHCPDTGLDAPMLAAYVVYAVELWNRSRLSLLNQSLGSHRLQICPWIGLRWIGLGQGFGWVHNMKKMNGLA